MFIIGFILSMINSLFLFFIIVSFGCESMNKKSLIIKSNFQVKEISQVIQSNVLLTLEKVNVFCQFMLSVNIIHK
ncbi:hypothetical protein D5E76_01245 [Vibrio parahaemolyticus]|nr:hypothetical protein D5E76_01245 [Vibrio parahaemolyticus]